LNLLAAAQLALGVRVAARMSRLPGGKRIGRVSSAPENTLVSVVLPVVNEAERVGGALAGLVMQGPCVREILVVDGGSADNTCEIVEWYAARDTRVKLIDARPRPAGWNGKIWGLRCGIEAADPASDWILTIDADVRPADDLCASLLTFARDESLDALSVATAQDIVDPALGALHGSMLATLVYRFGAPGLRAKTPLATLANGQCFLVRRNVLDRTGAIEAARDSRCEDITIARTLVASGFAVGFYQSEDLVSVRMYEGASEAWDNWPRSLPMQDRFLGPLTLALQMSEVLLVQALPLIAVALLIWSRPGRRSLFFRLNLQLLLVRLGMLAGLRGAYVSVPALYWLAPLLDLPVALRLIAAAKQREWTWRGVELVKDAG
jgi:dolichol-phosphate mannosyltransferase